MIACVAASVAGAVPAVATAAPLLQTVYKPHERTIPVSQSFLGLSTDWPLVYEHLQGLAAPGADPVYGQLVANLAAFGGGVPTLRVGGHTQDHAWWDPLGAPRPADLGIEFNIYPATLATLAASVKATSQRLILGVNMAANDVGLATAEVQAMQQALPSGSVLSYDLGNEPDGYGQRGLYTSVVGGQAINHTMRSPKTWGVGPYIRQFEQFATSIGRISPRPPLSATSGYGTLITAKPLLRRLHSKLALYTQHAYVGTACNPNGVPYPPSSPHAPTIPRLLSDSAEFATLGATLGAVADSARYHLPLRISEWQSYACGGKNGVSNTFAATLWGLDELLLDAAVGVSGVNVHFDNFGYAPFESYDLNGRRVATVEALYYSMLLFAEATGHHARILPSVVNQARVSRGAHVRAWGTREANRTLHFVVVDKDLHQSGPVVIRVPGAHGAATLIRLTAPSVNSFTGITLGGQTFAQPSYDGLLTGQPVHEVVAARGGAYTFTIGKTSAAMLTVPASSY